MGPQAAILIHIIRNGEAASKSDGSTYKNDESSFNIIGATVIEIFNGKNIETKSRWINILSEYQ